MMRTDLFLAIGLVALAGCAVGPDEAPDPSVPPKTWAEAAALVDVPRPATASAEPAVTSAAPPADFAFWVELNDPLLTGLVEEALRANPDLGRASARVREARAIAGISTAALFPSIDGDASYSRSRVSTESPNLARLNVDQIPGFDRDADDFRIAGTMAWEIDLFGKNRRARQAALADLGAEIEQRRAVGLALAGDVALSYIDYRTLVRRREIAERTLGSREAALEIVGARLQAGLGTDLDLARAEAETEAAGAAIHELTRLHSIAEHRLAILTGATPGALRQRLLAPSTPPAPFTVPIGLPAQLLTRRPDIRAASAALAAATARIGQAKADLFPQIVLGGEIGLDALEAGKLFTSGATYWSFGPSLRIPLFDAGRRLDAWTAAEERADGALHDLEGQILVALGEVEDTLASVREDERRRVRLASATEASRRAAQIAALKYRSGLVGYLDVIEADRALFAAEDALAEADGRVARNAVALSRAVGGGIGETERLMGPVDRPKRTAATGGKS